MTIEVNGQQRTLEGPHTVADLLVLLRLADKPGEIPSGIAVAVDAEVVPRSRFAEVALAEGQRVEILRAVGGG